MDFGTLGTFLYNGIVIGVFGTPLLFALFGALPGLYWIMNYMGLDSEIIMVVLGFVALTFSAGSFVSSTTTVSYLPGWVYGLVIIVAGYMIWNGLSKRNQQSG